MRTWPNVTVPELPGHSTLPQIWDSAHAQYQPSAQLGTNRATLYVCGITPYDSTHLGHLATYLAFDLLVRAWRDAGRDVVYAQCVTEVDDPLFERAQTTGVDWSVLAQQQLEQFRQDMTALRIIPPNHYRGVVEQIPAISQALLRLQKHWPVYQLPGNKAADSYLDITADQLFGSIAGLNLPTMVDLFKQNGGDPERPGKQHQLDPLLWRGKNPEEPWWDSPLGPGRPGWHIECAVIAEQFLGLPFDVQGGGADLAFPHHEMSTSHLRGLSGLDLPVRHHMHVGMVCLDGQKMSKSLGNLVFVSDLLGQGVEPMALRLALLAEHYRSQRHWSKANLTAATARLAHWRWALARADQPTIASQDQPSELAKQTLTKIRAAISHDLDSPTALQLLDQACQAGQLDAASAKLIRCTADSLLGITLC
ncbi:MAG: cysteine--1-D-myo-inosityl 2-amino-2-deoxy-alpha-D-glucopyranoside ligase [Bifidobacteriaceae bacterium]|jgi:L-cysteine:1D-myo-inositol 2-amino-2-deoxy-alpha-D-glucopyranoside ligase|nr:cysteine--1-D-myo-inosityl 2-amino-2-deoxy-alpha-D-glucopyranoside ligase [Bifidobacteriaceae bacterium]